MRLLVKPAGSGLRGEITPPGDKSISHRALIFTGLAHGVSRIEGLLVSGDTTATRGAMEQLGARFESDGEALIATGIGDQGLRAPEPDQVLDMGNSGTAMRLLAGVLAGQGFSSTLSGDVSLNDRPMGRIIRPLELMGAKIEAQPKCRAPLIIHGSNELKGIDYESSVASAQVKSCVLLAGLFAEGNTRLTEPRLSRDHTERMLPHFGVRIEKGPAIRGGQALHAADVRVPADPSSAAFLAAAALLVPDSDIVLHGVGLNPTRDGFFRVLELMGAQLDYIDRRQSGGEPVADIRVRYTTGLKGVDVPAQWIPSMIDEVPILLALASQLEGVTRIREAEELRVKESDRLAVMAQGLESMGINVEEYPDGIDVFGGRASRAPVESCHDHRCAMSFAVLGLRSKGGSEVLGAEYIDTSYPDFRAHLQSLGARIGVSES